MKKVKENHLIRYKEKRIHFSCFMVSQKSFILKIISLFVYIHEEVYFYNKFN